MFPKLKTTYLLLIFLFISSVIHGQVINITVLAGDTNTYFKIDTIILTDANCSVVDENGICNGTGSVQLNITSLHPDFIVLNYSLFGQPPVFTNSLTHTFNNICTGAYAIQMTGLVPSAPSGHRSQRILILFNLNGTQIFQTSPVIKNVECAGEDNGSIGLNISGGLPPYDVVWDHGPSSQSISNLAPNQYNVTIKDQVNCTTTQSFDIVDGDTLHTDFSFNTACVNSLVTFTGNSSTSNGVLSYEWDFPTGIPNTANTVGPHDILFATGGSKSIKLKIDNGVCQDSITKVIDIGSPPTVIISNDTSICEGGSVNLVASGGVSYTWVGTDLSDNNIQNPIATPTITTTYTVTVTGTNGCTNSKNVTIIVNPNPIASISSDTSVCINDTVQLSASGSVNYTWSPKTNLIGTNINSSINAIILNDITYKVIVSDNNSCKDSAEVTITAKILPNLTNSPDDIICEGDSVQLSVNGALSYIWTPNSAILNPNTDNPIVFPVINTRYSVTGTATNGCSDTNSTFITVVPPPSFTTSNDTSICFSESVILSVTGTDNYTWQPGNLSGNNVTVSPTNTTTYTVIATNGSGCTDSSTIKVTINPLPIISISPDTTICVNDDARLIASGGGTYNWVSPLGIPDNTNDSILVSPVTTTTYDLTVSTALSCTKDTSVTITVNPLPFIESINDTAVCLNSVISHSNNSTNNIKWNTIGGSLISNTQNFSIIASANETYILSVTDANSCVAIDSFEVTTLALPIVIPPIDTILCIGDSVQFTATGAVSYTWTPNNGAILSPSSPSTIIVPTINQTYQIIGHNADNCLDTASFDITTKPTPNLIVSNDTIICPGDSATISASGADNYTWTPIIGLENPNSAITKAFPIIPTDYVVKGTFNSNGCADYDTVKVDVSLIISVNNPANDTTICLGETVRLEATVINATVFSWSPTTGVANPASAITTVTPINTTTYVITASNGIGCTASDSITITVDQSPSVTITPDTTICEGDNINLIATGGGTYLWTSTNPISDNANDTIIFSSSSTATYNLTISTPVGCSIDTSVTVTVNPLPIVQAINDTSICEGSDIVYNTSAAGVIKWTTLAGAVISNTSNFSITPILSDTYILIATSGDDCSARDTFDINVLINPSLTIPNDTTLCSNDSVLFITSGATNYSWLPNDGSILSANNDSTIIIPTISQEYTVIGTISNNCTDTAHFFMTVLAIPNLTTSNDTIICPGDSVTISASGADSYTWTPALGLANPNSATTKVSPSIPTNYIVKGVFSGNGCFDTDTVKVDVSLIITVDSPANDTTICTGKTIPLEATVINASTIAWSPTTGIADPLSPITTVTPINTTTYVITASNTIGCTASDSITITVDHSPNVSISPDTTICENDTISITATGGGTYTWISNPASTLPSNDTISIHPIQTTKYTVSVSTPTGCTVDTSLTVTVLPIPVKPNLLDTTICFGETVTKIHNTNFSIKWINGLGQTLSINDTLSISPTNSDTYIVNITNAANCSALDTFNITVNSIPTVSINNSGLDTLCSGDSVLLTASGTLNYQWNASFGITSSTLTNPSIQVKPNTNTLYSVTGTDINGCNNTANYLLVVNNLPNGLVSNDTTICIGSSLQLSAFGGNKYIWSPIVDGLSNPNSTTVTLIPTQDRILNVRIEGNNGCYIDKKINITTNPLPSGVLTNTIDTLCYNNNNIVTAVLNNAFTTNINGTYSYNNGGFVNNPDFEITGTPAGNKTTNIRFKDQFDCISTPITHNTLVLDEITFEIDTIQFPECVGPKGEFKVKDILGGIAPYSINFNGLTTTDLNFIFKNIDPGTYPLSVSDKKTCTSDIILDFNSSITFDTNTTQPTCYGLNNGSIKISNVVGGVKPYQYSLQDKLNYSLDSNFNSLIADNYTVFIKDDTGCEIPISITLNQPDSLYFLPPTIKDEQCFGDKDGEITIIIQGGIPDYNVTINNSTITNDTISLQNLSPQTYPFTISDKNNCTKTDSIIINPANIFTTTASQIGMLTDCKANDASGQIDATTGGSGFYQYSLDNGVTFKTEINFENTDLKTLTAGVHIILTKDLIKGCTINSSLTIDTDINLDTLRDDTRAASCAGNDAHIELLNYQFITAPAPISYQLVTNPAGTIIVPNQATPVFDGSTSNPISGGKYSIIITDANTCEYNYDIYIPISLPMQVKDSISPTHCGQENGIIKLNVINGNAPYVVTVTYPNGKDSVSNNLLFDSLAGGKYIYKVVDNSSPIACQFIDSAILLNGEANLTLDITPVSCHGLRDGAIKIIAITNADTSNFNYSFIFNNLTATKDSSFTNIGGGFHSLQISEYNNAENTTCIYDDYNTYINIVYKDSLYTNFLTIPEAYVPEPDSIHTYVQTIPSDVEIPNGKIHIDSIYGSSNPYFISLNDTNSFINFNAGTGNQYLSLSEGSYTVYTKDSRGCFDTTQVAIGVRFFIPNIFTPNFDGVNDHFEVFNYESAIDIKIYDRWGTVIYESDDYANDWDGGTAPDGTYFYEVKTENKVVKGWVEIIR